MSFNAKNHRYALRRDWLGTGPRINFVMLNPSTADERVDDPTIRKCVGFAKRWGASSIVVTNCFAFRSTSPVQLMKIPAVDAIGGDWENDAAIATAATESDKIVCAWGDLGNLHQRAARVYEILRINGRERGRVLGFTKAGAPRHPLMVAYATALQPWEGPK